MKTLSGNSSSSLRNSFEIRQSCLKFYYGVLDHCQNYFSQILCHVLAFSNLSLPLAKLD